MTRLPAVEARVLIKALRSTGFIGVRQVGSHLTLRNPQTDRVVTIPVHSGRDIAFGTLRRILKDAGIGRDEFLKLLGRG